MFLVDAALALAAALETTPTGFHFENLVATDVAMWKDSGFGRAVYYWHTGSGQEVDFVLELNTYLLPDIISAPWRAALWRSLCTRARAPWPSLLR